MTVSGYLPPPSSLLLFPAHLVHDAVPAHVEDQLRVRAHLLHHRARRHHRAVRRDLRTLLLQGARALPEDAGRPGRGQGHHDSLKRVRPTFYEPHIKAHKIITRRANRCLVN